MSWLWVYAGSIKNNTWSLLYRGCILQHDFHHSARDFTFYFVKSFIASTIQTTWQPTETVSPTFIYGGLSGRRWSIKYRPLGIWFRVILEVGFETGGATSPLASEVFDSEEVMGEAWADCGLTWGANAIVGGAPAHIIWTFIALLGSKH